jgi:protein required for attachment to host cells
MTSERVTWVAVLDGAKSLLFVDKGFADAPDLHLVDKEQYDPQPDRDLKTDGPGTSHSSVGPGRSSVQEPDYHDQAEARFVADIAGTLNKAALTNKYDRLVVMAPPRAMGQLREELHDEATRRIVKELTGDYTNHPTLKLEGILKKEMAAHAEPAE